jgi:hypothetical protein
MSDLCLSMLPNEFFKYSDTLSFICFVHNRRVASGKTLSRALVRPFSPSLPILKSMFFTVS